MSSIDRVAPYVEQLLENRDVRADIQRAASKARQAYAGARGKKAKRKVLADKRIRRRVGESVMAARDAVLDLQQARETELRKQRRRRRVRLVVLGTLAGAAMVAANERVRTRLASQLGIGADAAQAPPETTPAVDQDAVGDTP